MIQPARYVALTYEYVEDIVDRRPPYRDDHLSVLREAKERGELVAAGAVGEPPHGGLFIFTGDSAAPAEAFMAADPYVAAGLVTSWRIDPWNVVV